MTAQTAIGWGLSGHFIAFMIFDGAIKVPPIAPVTQTMKTIGWPTDAGTARLLGIIGILCTALYAWPPTAVLGAVLLTATSAAPSRRSCASPRRRRSSATSSSASISGC